MPAKSLPAQTDIPDAPWRVAGRFVAMVGLIAVPLARKALPGDYKLVRVFPGYTVGAIFVAEYTDSSVGPYSELGIIPATVRVRGTRRMCISHIYVDNERSLAGGRDIWGLPKKMATFTWSDSLDPDGRERLEVLVCEGDTELLHLQTTRQLLRVPGSFKLPMVSQLGDRVLRWQAKIKSKAYKVHAELTVNPEAPFADLRPLPAAAVAGVITSAVISGPF